MKHLNRTEILIIIFFLILNLRILTWFQPNHIIMDGDLRPPINPIAFYTHALSLTNNIDYRLPSVYLPRLLEPFLSLTALFETIGLSIENAELTTIFTIYLLVQIVIYKIAKELTESKTVGFITAVFFTSNTYLVVDRDISAIGFISLALTILPSLLAWIFALKKQSWKYMILSAILFSVTYATFPNYKAPLLAILSIFGIFIYLRLQNTIILNRKLLKHIAIFLVTLILSSSWILTYFVINYQNFLATNINALTILSTTYYNHPSDVLRLITQWGFYSGDFGKPYIFYAQNYLTNFTLIILTYIPTTLVCMGLLILKSRKQQLFLSLCLISALILTMGFTINGAEIYFKLVTTISLLAPFRTPSNWTFILVLLFSLLIGMATKCIINKLRNNIQKIITLAVIFTVFFAGAYPLFNGDISRNWLNINDKGVILPDYFTEVDMYRPQDTWMLILPQKTSYLIYDFDGELLNCGNPYPLIFSKPYISGIGTEYVQSQQQQKILDTYKAAYKGDQQFLKYNNVTYLLIEYNIVLGNLTDIASIKILQTNLTLIHQWKYASLFKIP